MWTGPGEAFLHTGVKHLNRCALHPAQQSGDSDFIRSRGVAQNLKPGALQQHHRLKTPKRHCALSSPQGWKQTIVPTCQRFFFCPNYSYASPLSINYLAHRQDRTQGSFFLCVCYHRSPVFTQGLKDVFRLSHIWASYDFYSNRIHFVWLSVMGRPEGRMKWKNHFNAN